MPLTFFEEDALKAESIRRSWNPATSAAEELVDKSDRAYGATR